MPMQLKEEEGGKILVVHVTGELVKEDYGALISEFERLQRKHGKLRLLFDMTGLKGWTASAGWEDFKFGMKHFLDVERLAMVGDKRWEHLLAIVCKPFTYAKTRYFDQADTAQASAWLRET